MRELVQKTIIANYQKGLDELGIPITNIQRELEGRPQLVDKYLSDWKPNPEFDIQKFVDSLTDEELLYALLCQARQDYR